MEEVLVAVVAALVGAVTSLVVAELTRRGRLQEQRLAHRTEFVAEETAHRLLSHQQHLERSFEYLSKTLGGFEDDELRKILVRSGAVRDVRRDNTEWWYLLERENDLIEKRRRASATDPRR